jgi:hypothetical protein
MSVAEPEPSYKGHLDFSGITVREGQIDAAADWETAGTGAVRLLAALQAQGRFSVQGNPLLAADPPCESAAGLFTFAGSRFQFTNLQVTSAGETWQGHGSTGLDGRLQLELSAGAATPRQLRAGGRLW